MVISRVECTTDVPCVDSAHGRSSKGVDASENGVNLNVSTVSPPPALNNADVVAEDLEVTVCHRAGDKVSEKELKANGFCPANALPMSLLLCFYPGMRCHTCQRGLIVIVMPTPELASE